MTVHFKGISEYRSRYKDRATRSRSDSPHQRMRPAELRSDQTRNPREPQFLSKRKVPFYPPQVSSSLRWEGHDSHHQRLERSRPVTPPAVKPAEREVTPLAPRDTTPQEGTAAPSQQQETQPAQPAGITAERPKQRLGVNHALRKRAGLKAERQRNSRLSSEYQRQFMWKTPVADSPLLAAHEVFYNDNKIIPPFKSNPVIMESEYRRCFKGSPPPRPPRLRRDVEQCQIPENGTPEENKRKKKKKERQHSRKSSQESSQEKLNHPQSNFQQEVRSPCAPRDLSPKNIRKAKTEYRSNFCSPLQYCYRDGVWVKARTAVTEGCEHDQWWYREVQELRERAEAYRKRAWGTHFSHQHLNQIMSENNWMWEPSSGTSSSSSVASGCCRSANSSHIVEALDLASPGPSASVATSRRSSVGQVVLPEGPTLPVQRKLAWNEEARPGEKNEAEISREELTVKKCRRNSEDEELNANEKIGDVNKRLQVLESDSSSVSGGSINEGRLPTPELKTTQTVQRTHHDRTTPATGGALLVSSPKIKNSSLKVRKNEPPLGKPNSPYRHTVDGSPHIKALNRSSQHSSPAAGLNTEDPLPVRYDGWSEEPEYSTNARPAKPSQTQKRQRPKARVSSPANRIQGTMRNPQFQHNGNLGILRPEMLVFPDSDSAISDNDDKMSQISVRSASSCSMASQILDRAQRRKQEFWGKS